ncbi:MAG: MotA/TolQ/ExbB proton channel family protein [Planctomycetia bacterium]
MFQKLKAGLFGAGDPSLVLAAVATVAYYVVVLQPAFHGTILQKYSTEHPVDYVIVALLFWGLIDLVMKLTAFPREMLAQREKWLPPRAGRLPIAQAAALLEAVRSKPRRLLETRIGRRVADGLEYVVETGSVDDLRDHLQYLSDQDREQTHARYTLARFVIMVTPILGFLGTVVHFGTALSGISFDDMAEKLPHVVSEMGEAFNTTTVALAAAMTMMFGLFMVERMEHRLDGFNDHYLERELLNRFETKNHSLSPFLSVVQTANDQALAVIAATLDRQVAAWSQSFETLFRRFDDRQRHESAAWAGALEALQQHHQTLEAGRDDRLAQALALMEGRQNLHLAHLETALEGVGSLKSDLQDLGKTLTRVFQDEGRLVELQHALSDNLRVLHETRHIDDAMHGLTAAIHLLTSRHRGGGVSEAA